MKHILILTLLSSLAIIHPASAQQVLPTPPKEHNHKHSLYLSWGYNGEWYTHSTVHVSQPSLGNDYTFQSVQAHDHPGWDTQSIFTMALSIPQYNYRLGYMFNEEKGLGIEINFDHTKYIIAEDQDIHVTGRMGDHQADTTIRFSEANGFYYYLNNGANFLLINLVKRFPVREWYKGAIRLDALGKAGIGPVIPHVQNALFGKDNDPKFQLGGWNAGLEGDIKATFFRYVYLEYGAKLDYARYANLEVYKGTAKQAFGTFEMILSLGVQIPPRKI